MKDAKTILNQQFDELVTTLQNVIRYKTEKGAEEQGAPFGREVRNCLDYVLSTAESFGLTTYNDDGYAGHVDLKGSGNEVLGILGHLDVVPANASEWKYPPYGAEIHDGKLFGRGTMDDKGPMIACLYAVKALKEAGFEPKRTIRLIFGCDEETDMGCVRHYFNTMPRPDVAFSPDGDFPVINREKGIYHFNIELGKLPKGVSITAGDRANVVPSLCTATIPASDWTKANLNLSDANVTVNVDGKVATITATGKAAHASTPNEGVNATHPVLQVLAQIYGKSQALQFLANKVCDTSGSKWGIILHDEQSGDLTCNLGVLRTDNTGNLTATVDIRFPVTYNCDYMTKLLQKCTPAEFTMNPWHISDPLYVPAESHLVTTLMSVYNKAMNTDLDPIAIGGGTYSRCLNNCVAFGPLFPNEEQTIHMPNECVDLNNLKLMAEIFLDAIYQLAK
ncbi:MAG: Sapep family Mn(2+)-dependent dipeptidase [Clostridia bacterium]|nr:Sapep family Mn(2+)-dependent dipeptidase [Clostridia bacterium]